MCGIAGIWSRTNQEVSMDRIGAMVQALAHRGPDAAGQWAARGLLFGHRRLKILDMSDLANQPYTDGVDSLIFNGRIFNYQALRKELSDRFEFRTDCDTEVLFRALQVWGTSVFEHIRGQFAFVFYKHSDRQLIVARDHAGICPLYTLETPEEILFCSEIKPLLMQHKCALDKEALLDYFKYRYNIQNSKTLFAGVRRFPPAHFLTIDMETGRQALSRYWRLTFNETAPRSDADIQSHFNHLMDEQISSQQMAHVPVGLYLSGGIDSGALLKGFAKASADIESFTLSFFPNDSDTRRVEALSQTMKFKKNLIEFSPEHLDELEEVVFSLEEPFGDFIIAANYFLAQCASRSVRVVLSGEGGDEAFLGYDHQRSFLKLRSLTANGILGPLMAGILRMLPASIVQRLQSYPGSFDRDATDKIARIVANASTPVSSYLELVSLFTDSDLTEMFRPGFMPSGIKADVAPITEIFEHDEEVWQSVLRVEIEQMTLIVNLLKQERFGMRFSMEGCVPFVSREVLDFVSSLSFGSLFSRINKRILLNYSEQSVIKKKPFSLFETNLYLQKLISLFDQYTQSSSATGILNPTFLEQCRSNLARGGVLGIKRAMAIVVFLIWYKKFQPYLKEA
ncbi:MAG: asparagine synthase (glutamine-hydrolyzing) [Leptospirales bacterium]|nr:asparagine synthase (glutamine-hydrolyzing) [Leptospirales bacterium]